MKLRVATLCMVLVFGLASLGQLCGCGGGGGGGGDRGAVPAPAGGTNTPTPAARPTGTVSGRLMLASLGAGRTAPRAASKFLMDIPSNTPQKLDVPETGYASLAGAVVTVTVDGVEKSATSNAAGEWVITGVPTGTVQFTVAENGKQAATPVTVAADKDNKNLTLLTESASGTLQAEGQTIHGDGTDGYKKETHFDATSDTVFENGIRDHHDADGATLRDTTDDGIVEQKFPDPNDDGVPDGPVVAQGGDMQGAPDSPGALVNNAPPEIDSISAKDNKDKNSDTVMAGDSLMLLAATTNAEGEQLAVHWTVEDAEGKDLTSLFLNNADIVAPTFSPPQGEYSKPGAYIVKASLTDPAGLETEKDIILSVDTPGNKAPHASIKANHTSGDAPLTVDFTCDASDKDGAIAKYCWDMDKSNGVNQQKCDDDRAQITKTFISAGKYRVTCIVTDDKGATGFDMRVVVVRKQKHPPQITKFTPDKTTVAPGESVNIAFAATDPDADPWTAVFLAEGGAMTDSNYSDGTVIWTAPQIPGEYTIDATVTDSDNEKDHKSININVVSTSSTNRAPTITASADPATGTAPLTSGLSATATDPDGDPVIVTWDFDDSNGIQTDASGATATVKYGGPGDYYATAKACDNKEACASAKVKVAVTQGNRQPYITNCCSTTDSAEIGDTIALNARAFDDDGDPLTYMWSILDGSLSSTTEQSPKWTVPKTPGEYTVSVAVTDGKSPPVSATETVTVLPDMPDKRPLSPATCGVTAGNGSALLRWTASPSDDVDHYKLSRVLNGAETPVSGNVARTATSFQDTGLANGSLYTYELYAVDADGYVSDKCPNDMSAQPQQEIDTTTPVGDSPGNGDMDPVSDRIFVPNEGDGTVSVIDAATGQVIKTIVVGMQPVYACTDPARRLAYIVNKGSNTVSVIDENTMTVVAAVSVGSRPESCAVNSQNGDLFVGNAGGNSVSIIDPVTRAVKKTLQAGQDPTACDVDAQSKILFVTNKKDNNISFYDTETYALLKSINLGMPPGGCVANGDTGEVYVPYPDDGKVGVITIPGGEIEQPIETGGSPECKCSINKIANQIYITNKIKRTITFINGATKQSEREITLPVEPRGTCGADVTRNKVCVPNKGGDAAIIINNPLPNHVVDSILPPLPEVCHASGNNGSVDLNWHENSVCALVYPTPPGCIITAFSIKRGLSASGPFTEIGTASKDASAYRDTGVTNGTKYYYTIASKRQSGNESPVCAVDATPAGEVAGVIPQPNPASKPCCTAHDEVRNYVYIANEETNTVDVIDYDTQKLIRTINVGDGCCGDIVHNRTTNKIYITNKTTNKLTVINGTDWTIEEIIDIPGAGGGKCTINEITNEIFITNDIENEIIVYNPGTGRIIRIPMPVPSCPCDVTVNKITNEIFVTNKTSNKLTIINGTDYTIEEIVDIGGPGGPGHCIINEKTNTLYMTNETTNEVVVYNRKADRIVRRITVGVQPVCKPCAVDEDRNEVYITNQGSGTVSIIDGATYNVLASIPVGSDPNSVIINPNSNQLVVLNSGDANLTVLNNPTPAAPSDSTPPAIPSGVMASSALTGITLTWNANTESDLVYYNIYRKPEGGQYGPVAYKYTINNTWTDTTAATGTKYIYSITAVDTSVNESAMSNAVSGRTDVPTDIAVGTYPANLTVNETLNRVYVSNRDSNNVSIIDAQTHTVTGTVATGAMPWGLAADPLSGKVYVANLGALGVTIFNGSTGAVIATAPTGGTLISGVAIDNINGKYYVSHSNYVAPQVIPMNLATNAPSAGTPTRPGSIGIAVNRTTRRVYTANSLDNSVSVINGITGAIIATVPVDAQPTDVVVNEATNKIYVSCGGPAKVLVIDGNTNTVTNRIPTGLEPMGMSLDTTRNLLYVANSSGGSVSAIDTATETVTGEILVGGDPSDVVVHTGLNQIFVTERTAGKVIVRDGL